jgi:pyruvate kinase
MPEVSRRAKIICTLGPATASVSVIRKLIRAGMDVARVNFSHGDREFHSQVIRNTRQVAKKEGLPVGILQDLQGPKVRTGPIPDPGILLPRQGRFVLTTRKGVHHEDGVSVSHRGLPGDVSRGDRILLDDGLLELEVERIRGTEVTCRVLVGGLLTSHKGINIPGRKLSVPALTAKDRRDLAFGIEKEVDFVALSFVRGVEDLSGLRRALDRGGSRAQLIAKLEKPQAVENLESIVLASDGIMVARGDLGVEMPPEQVPLLQKRMIRLARRHGKPVITATQMLESMIHNPRPTRAEASDVANAVLDGTDAVMLSGETAVGHYPVDTVRMMDRIVRTTEQSNAYRLALARTREERDTPSVADAIGESAAQAARNLDARMIAVFTTSGSTARLVSRYRPGTRIAAFTPDIRVRRQLSLVWGVEAFHTREFPSTDTMIQALVKGLRQRRAVKRGDLVIITAGTPVGHSGTTNFLKIHRVE